MERWHTLSGYLMERPGGGESLAPRGFLSTVVINFLACSGSPAGRSLAVGIFTLTSVACDKGKMPLLDLPSGVHDSSR